MKSTRQIAAAVILLTFIGCYTSNYQSPPPQDRNYLSRGEIAASPRVRTAYEAVQFLRPLWLCKSRVSPRGILVYPSVFIDMHLLGEINELRYINVDIVGCIWYLNQYDAMFQFGSFYALPAGAIWIVTGATL